MHLQLYIISQFLQTALIARRSFIADQLGWLSCTTHYTCPPEMYCSEDEVLALIKILDTPKASGPDGVHLHAQIYGYQCCTLSHKVFQCIHIYICNDRFPACPQLFQFLKTLVEISKHLYSLQALNNFPTHTHTHTHTHTCTHTHTRAPTNLSTPLQCTCKAFPGRNISHPLSGCVIYKLQY